MSLNTAQLIKKLPQSWWGLFGATRSPDSQAVELWFQNQTKSRYGCLADWEGLLQELCTEEPVCNSSGLHYSSRFVQLPNDIQCHVLSFLLRHREEIHWKSLENFVLKMKAQVPAESWSDVLLRSLSVYVKMQACEKQGSLLETTYTFTSCNEIKATSLCEKLKTETTSATDPWTIRLDLQEKLLVNHAAINKQKRQSVSPDSNMGLNTEIVPLKINCDQSGVHDNNSEPSIQLVGSQEVIILDEDDDEEPQQKKKKIGLDESLGSQIHPNEQTADVDSSEQTADIDSDLIEKMRKLKEIWQSGTEVATPGDLDFFVSACPTQVERVCKALQFDKLTDAALGLACQQLSTLSSIITHNNCVQFLSCVVHPKISVLSQSSLRQLVGVISLAAENFPRPLIDGVFIKCFQQDLGALQADLLCKLIKETLSGTCSVYLLEQIIKNVHTLNDNGICVIQTLVNDKMQVAPGVLTELLKLLSSHSKAHKENLKFGRLIMAVLNKYGHQLSDEDKDMVMTLTQAHGTFLKKKLMACLNRLTK